MSWGVTGGMMLGMIWGVIQRMLLSCGGIFKITSYTLQFANYNYKYKLQIEKYKL